MRKKWATFVFVLFSATFFFSCASTPPPSPTTQYFWFCEPPTHKAQNEYFSVRLIPVCSFWGCTGFDFYLENKTGRHLKIDWNNTHYLKDGEPAGGFMFKDVVFKDVYGQKSFEIVTPIGTAGHISRTLWPNDLVFYDDLWRHRPMEPGESGIDLFVIDGSREINEKLSIELSYELKAPRDIRRPCMEYRGPDATKHDWAGISVIDTHKGVGVVDILHLRSPAKYKIWEGDVIKEINNQPVKDTLSYLETMLSLRDSHSPTQFVIVREDRELSVTVIPYTN